jgi:hypothetical protein
MKKIVQCQEVEGEGLEALLGEWVILFCSNYFYSGKLIGVNDKDVLLQCPQIVYETGPLGNKTFKDAQDLPAKEWRVRTLAIESYGLAPQRA